MATSRESESPTPMETTEGNGAPLKMEASIIKDDQWRAMRRMVDNIYLHRTADGHDPSKIFHRKPNKRQWPDYYDVIKEPVALSTLKAKHMNRQYQNFAEFVRDCALISHNAQVYNRPDTGAYVDSLTVKGFMIAELQKIVEQGIITAVEAAMPDLGDIPPISDTDLAVEEAEEEEGDDDDDDDDDDDEIDESDEEDGRRKKKRGPRSTAAIAKREGVLKEGSQKGKDGEPRKKRGRPPKVDTPEEARMNRVYKGIRKFKNEYGHLMIKDFDKLPDKTEFPDYYQEVKDPIDVGAIKRKWKRKKYQSLDQYMKDIDKMFNNAKAYNQDGSPIYIAAVHLQREAHKIADQEKRKPDTDFVMEEGRLPLPNGILNNGELWKIGDWVHIQNANDMTKPIVAQIYRTWQDAEGEKWVNAVWYYRPEQTVHQYQKHFFPNEIFKTGQYRDHRIDDVMDRCFVMFHTRYSKGRPRGFPIDKEVYVCESRYNEEKHKFNQIKTWASCLPDEVRDRDYEMDLFDHPRKVKKVPSPLLHMLKDDAKEIDGSNMDELPKVRWGVENAPPIVGAIWKGPRDENQSPPPEPTPTPPPPPPQAVRPVANVSSHDTSAYRRGSELDSAMGGMLNQASVSGPPPSYSNYGRSHSQTQVPQYHQHSASPAPVRPHQYSQSTTSYVPQSHHSTSTPVPHPSIPDRYAQTVSKPTPTALPTSNFNPPRPVEVWHLSDAANQTIPEDIREKFQRDQNGHVLFWTTPPVDVLAPLKPGSAVGHTARYLAEKIRRRIALKQQGEGSENIQSIEEQPAAKKPKTEPSVSLTGPDNGAMGEKALIGWVKIMEAGTLAIQKATYGDRLDEGIKWEHKHMAELNSEAIKERLEREEFRQKLKERRKVPLMHKGPYLDDIDPRLGEQPLTRNKHDRTL